MAGKYKELGTVLSQECIAPDIYSMWILTDQIAEEAVPGQFISVYSRDGSRLLPPPWLAHQAYNSPLGWQPPPGDKGQFACDD